MEREDLLKHIEREALARDLLEFVKVRSETRHENEGSLFYADLLRREGFEPQFDEVAPGRANVYAVLKGNGSATAKARSLVLNGHIDTIAAGHCDPPAIQNGWVIGRGSEDMKCGLVAMVHAASTLRKSCVSLAGDLWVTGVIGHEDPNGKKEGPRRLIERLRGGEIHAHGILIGEGPCAIWRASLGMTLFTVTITSAHGPIHTLQVPYEENPARWLGELLREFEVLEKEFSAAAPHPLCGRERINIGIACGGDYYNRLPTPITVTGTWRWQPGKSQEDVKGVLKRICDLLTERSGLTFEVSFNATREPFETPQDHPLVWALQHAGAAVAGRVPEDIGMPLVGDGSLYANEGQIPAVYYGPTYETAHSDHERVSIAQLTHCAQVYALAAAEFCQ
jgi:acetylornithine deacetylase/succinyl-diaminopimelate desuccinylase-like protein